MRGSTSVPARVPPPARRAARAACPAGGRRPGRGRRLLLTLGVALMAASGCQERDLTLPADADVSRYFEASRIASARMNGNVAEITIAQSSDQLRRGGSIWARVGPYIYLFSEPTRDLFVDFDGLAGVRVITTVGSVEVARALLPRTALNDLTWRRALNVAGRARLEGTERVTLLEDLIVFGEDHTEHDYNERYISR